MILRLFRYRLHPGTRHRFEAAANGDDGFARLAHAPGLCFALGGRSREDAHRGVVLTAWETFEALDAVVPGGLEQPSFLPVSAFGLIAERRVTHWEALDLPRVGTGEPGILHLVAGSVDAATEAGYYSGIRSDVWPALAGVPGLAGAWVGRQHDGREADPVLGVSLWWSLEAVTAAGRVTRPILCDCAGLDVEAAELFDVFGLVRAPVTALA